MPKKTTTKSGNKKQPLSGHREKEICKPLIDRITSRRTFEPFDKPTVGCRFLRFKRRGESVIGMLGFPIQNFRQGTSYPLQLESGEVVEIIGNKLLHKQIREGELCGRCVKIIYQGREFTGGGHHRKIFRVFQVGSEQVSSEAWGRIITGRKKCQTKNTVQAAASR